MKTLSATPNPEKEIQSLAIAKQTAAFEKSGGKIQIIPFGVCKQGSVDSMRQYPEVIRADQ